MNGPTWEYLVDFWDPLMNGSEKAWLDERGRDGWQVCIARPRPPGYTFVFMRCVGTEDDIGREDLGLGLGL